MKKILITALLLVGITATAQVKVGTNPTTLATNAAGTADDANFQVEGETASGNRQFVILQNGNVGIGTTTPDASLRIEGGNFKYIPTVSATAPLGSRFEVGSPGGFPGFILTRGDGSGGNEIRYDFRVNTSGAFQIFESHPAFLTRFSITNSGNVGIGTATPTEKLDVAGSIKMVDGNQAAGAFMVSDANGKATWTPAATALGASASKWTNDAANTRVALTNLSDGTTARPAEKSLFVHDRGSVTINSQRSDFVNDASSLGLGVVDNELTFTASSATAVGRYGIYEYSVPNIASGLTLSGTNQFLGIRADMLRVGATNGGTINGFMKGIQTSYGHHSSVDAAATSETIVGFYARPHSQQGTITNLYDFLADDTYVAGGTVTNRYGIGIDGTTKKNYFMGSVGIGTNNPLNKLHIEGSGIMARLASTSATGNNYMLFTNNGVNSGYMGYGGSTTEHLTLMNITTTGNVILGTQNSQRLVVAANGKIGIGTDAPADILHLAIAGGTATTQGIRFTQPSFTSQAGFMNFSTANQNLQVGTTGSTMGVSFFTNNTERMRIVGNNGYVGIGTNAPDAKLQVNEGSVLINSVSGAKKVLTAKPSILQVIGADDSETNSLLSVISPGYGVSTLRPAILEIISTRSSNAQLVAGTYTPTQTNDILGRLAFGGDTGSSLRGNGGHGQAYIQGHATENYTATAMGNRLSFSTTPNGSSLSNERLTINHNGNVGIGTKNPGSKLSVVGLPVHASNAAAITAGLVAGDFFHAGDGLVRVVF